MFYKMIQRKRDMWYSSSECTIDELISYIVNKGEMRDVQIDAIKTYLYLKIACENKPLWELFSRGYFNNLNVDDLEVKASLREKLQNNPAALALYEYSTLKNEKDEQVSEKLEKAIINEIDNIDFVDIFKKIFYNVSYTDYLFSLPMGAGKTYLMAAFIYLDLYFAVNEPDNNAFAHNFIIFAPSGLKSSVVPSLKTIKNSILYGFFPILLPVTLRESLNLRFLIKIKRKKEVIKQEIQMYRKLPPISLLIN
ncbi:hypothetical protein [Thermoanaerobacterium thermosaccharolyticum]|uniref:hypothetical protein n=1 Tax=Thermoanaerobacterium thermosaccharolyticum TaxID=1517 RepID=UPI003D2C01B7